MAHHTERLADAKLMDIERLVEGGKEGQLIGQLIIYYRAGQH